MARFAALVLLTASAGAVLHAQTGTDLNGKAVNPFAATARKAVVLVFVRRDCPVSSRYAPVIQEISAEYEREVQFWLVFPDRADTSVTIGKYLADYRYHLPALQDSDQSLVKIAHVEITPEVAVFDRNHKLIYDGRIDNWYVDLTRSRPAPTTHELKDAILAALDGKSMTKPEIRGVGCYIADVQ